MSRALSSLWLLLLGFAGIFAFGVHNSLSAVQTCALLMLVSYAASTWCNRSWRVLGKTLPELYADIRRGRASTDTLTGMVLKDLTFFLLLVTVAALVAGA